ncbi:MAG: hypothetical protein KGJ10_09350 [Acidobacteriota bacterium]|nr:hypothetical protein [Acidobacteriota bacterium]MDE3045011.1 hypothetical protein [Acidobacteriota bacterium]
MASQIRTIDCSAREANRRLRTARAYLEAAELIFVDDREEFAGVAAGNAVLAGIAAADAICGKGLRKCFRGDDHRQAAELLATASPDGPKHKKLFVRLLDLKDAAHYGFGDFSKSNALKAVKLARELVSSADALFQR